MIGSRGKVGRFRKRLEAKGLLDGDAGRRGGRGCARRSASTSAPRRPRRSRSRSRRSWSRGGAAVGRRRATGRPARQTERAVKLGAVILAAGAGTRLGGRREGAAAARGDETYLARIAATARPRARTTCVVVVGRRSAPRSAAPRAALGLAGGRQPDARARDGELGRARLRRDRSSYDRRRGVAVAGRSSGRRAARRSSALAASARRARRRAAAVRRPRRASAADRARAVAARSRRAAAAERCARRAREAAVIRGRRRRSGRVRDVDTPADLAESAERRLASVVLLLALARVPGHAVPNSAAPLADPVAGNDGNVDRAR